MLKPMVVEQKRASWELIKALVAAGILEITDTGIRCKEKQTVAP